MGWGQGGRGCLGPAGLEMPQVPQVSLAGPPPPQHMTHTANPIHQFRSGECEDTRALNNLRELWK